MKILLTALNAKYIHSALSVYSLKAYARCENVHTLEFTINQDPDYILSEIIKQNADMVGFSVYIWNVEVIKKLARNIKKINPKTIIFAGGPEAGYDESLLKSEPSFSFIIDGEGEYPIWQLAKGEHYSKLERKEVSLDDIPFIYTDENINLFKNRIIYFETSRGCPYSCSYCLSSATNGVKYMSLERVYKYLDLFLRHRVPQVKLVDRTFNASVKHAVSIWEYLIEHDNGVTNFHFEITGDLLNEQTFETIKNARSGLFQFEIGVQSTNPKTLDAINRKTDLTELFNSVNKIKSFKNIHQHLDLIAGLPYEGICEFKRSFNDIYALNPEQFQLGFLKLLKGSAIFNKKEEYGIVYRDYAPYEVLLTNDISYDELASVKKIEELIETYYNSGLAPNTLKYGVTFFDNPYDFYEKLCLEYNFNVKHSKPALYEYLFNFLANADGISPQILNDTIKFDMLLNDNIKNMPGFITKNPDYIKEASRLTKNTKSSRVEIFDLDVLSLGHKKEKERIIVEFDYFNRDILTNKATVRKIYSE